MFKRSMVKRLSDQKVKRSKDKRQSRDEKKSFKKIIRAFLTTNNILEKVINSLIGKRKLSHPFKCMAHSIQKRKIFSTQSANEKT